MAASRRQLIESLEAERASKAYMADVIGHLDKDRRFGIQDAMHDAREYANSRSVSRRICRDFRESMDRPIDKTLFEGEPVIRICSFGCAYTNDRWIPYSGCDIHRDTEETSMDTPEYTVAEFRKAADIVDTIGRGSTAAILLRSRADTLEKEKADEAHREVFAREMFHVMYPFSGSAWDRQNSRFMTEFRERVDKVLELAKTYLASDDRR